MLKNMVRFFTVKDLIVIWFESLLQMHIWFKSLLMKCTVQVYSMKNIAQTLTVLV